MTSAPLFASFYRRVIESDSDDDDADAADHANVGSACGRESECPPATGVLTTVQNIPHTEAPAERQAYSAGGDARTAPLSCCTSAVRQPSVGSSPVVSPPSALPTEMPQTKLEVSICL
jgi:hypothetical protein